MNGHTAGQVFQTHACFHNQRGLANQKTGVRSQYVDAQSLAGSRLYCQFYKTFRVGRDPGLTQLSELKDTGSYVKSLFPCLPLAKPNGSDLRLGKDTVRQNSVIHYRVQTEGALHRYHPLPVCNIGQLAFICNVSCCIYVRDAGETVFVHLYVPPFVNVYASLCKAQVICVGGPSDAQQGLFRLQRLCACTHTNTLALNIKAGYRFTCYDPHSLPY